MPDLEDERRTLIERVRRGSKYRQFAESELTEDCLADQEKFYFEALKVCDDEQKAIQLWHRLRAAGRFREALHNFIADGDMAQSEIDRIERHQEHGAPSTPITRPQRG